MSSEEFEKGFQHHFEVLLGPRVKLRSPVESDKQDRLSYGRNLEYSLMVGEDPSTIKPLTKDDVAQWYDRCRREYPLWLVEVERRCIGIARLHSLNMENRSAKPAIGIFNPDYWCRGYGTEIMQLLLEFAFKHMGLHRVEAQILQINYRSIACSKKCGFVEEGIEREALLIGDQWYNYVRMSLLDHEYRAKAHSD